MIAGAGGSNPALTPRWDRVDSRRLIAVARKVYFKHLTTNGYSLDPLGVVVNGQHDDGRVVFEMPTLLPEEQFISAELIGLRLKRPRVTKDRARGGAFS
ncbi:Conserved hypothetical protein [Synechococcus sp. WH 7803]|nr:Conserved hypothetical protein [Synechococcus sp. WH 7803]